MSFDIEGMGRTRSALEQMARTPKANNRSIIHRKVINELYSEIRAARIAGHSWRAIAETIAQHARVKISGNTLGKVFHEIDKAYSKETDVPPLPDATTIAKKRGRPAKK